MTIPSGVKARKVAAEVEPFLDLGDIPELGFTRGGCERKGVLLAASCGSQYRQGRVPG